MTTQTTPATYQATFADAPRNYAWGALFVALIACVFGVGALVALKSQNVTVAVDTGSGEHHARGAGPVAQTKAVTVTAAAAVELFPGTTAGLLHYNGSCVNTSTGVPVYIVNPDTAAATADGSGPYCDTCVAGAVIPIGGRDWVRTSGGTAALACRFYSQEVPLGGSGGGGVSSALVCLLSGGTNCTMTGPVLIASGTVGAPGAALAADADGTGTGLYRDGANSLAVAANGVFIGSFGTTGTRLRTAAASPVSIGTVGNEYFGVTVGAAIPTSVSVGDFGHVGTADGKFIWTPRAATITSPTDTTTAPAHGTINMSSSGAAAWTPSETGAENGSRFLATNSGANAITLTNAAGIYEKGPCIVGQYGSVEFAYFVDRFVQISCNP